MRCACFVYALASFFLIHLALSVFASVFAPGAMRRAERIAERQPARTAAMMLLALRLFPAVLALAAVAALCVPSFLSFESERGAEAAGIPFLAAAALGASIWAISLTRSLRALVRSHRHVPRRSSSPRRRIGKGLAVGRRGAAHWARRGASSSRRGFAQRSVRARCRSTGRGLKARARASRIGR